MNILEITLLASLCCLVLLLPTTSLGGCPDGGPAPCGQFDDFPSYWPEDLDEPQSPEERKAVQKAEKAQKGLEKERLRVERKQFHKQRTIDASNATKSADIEYKRAIKRITNAKRQLPIAQSRDIINNPPGSNSHKLEKKARREIKNVIKAKERAKDKLDHASAEEKRVIEFARRDGFI